MALSNIFKEPRREIIETVAGLVLLLLFLVSDWGFAVWFNRITGPDRPCPIFVGLIFGVAAVFLFWGLAIIIHSLGEWICGILARNGHEIRPKQRYR